MSYRFLFMIINWYLFKISVFHYYELLPPPAPPPMVIKIFLVPLFHDNSHSISFTQDLQGRSMQRYWFYSYKLTITRMLYILCVERACVEVISIYFDHVMNGPLWIQNRLTQFIRTVMYLGTQGQLILRSLVHWRNTRNTGRWLSQTSLKKYCHGNQ